MANDKLVWDFEVSELLLLSFVLLLQNDKIPLIRS
jgi:hypothetical protein